MLTRKSCLKIALMVGLVPLAGCGTSSMAQRSGTTKDVAMQRPNIRTRAVSADSASELRIPATPVSASGGSQRVSNNDIPLVPIPPVPRKEEVQQTNIARTNLNPANPNTMSNFPTEVPIFTFAIPQSLPCTERNSSISARCSVKIAEDNPWLTAF